MLRSMSKKIFNVSLNLLVRRQCEVQLTPKASVLNGRLGRVMSLAFQ